jgi:hypothetical protein
MQPIKITISGDYFDCQIYRGRLYLWSFNCKLSVYDWGAIVNSLAKDPADVLMMRFCFINGSYLYKSEIVELFGDPDFKKLLLFKFSTLENQTFDLTEGEIKSYLIGEQEAPTNMLPTDTEIFGNKLYLINENGLHVSTAHREKSNKYPVSSRPNKLWDCNLLSLKASKGPQIALSGGSDGLYELNLSDRHNSGLKPIEPLSDISLLSEKHSLFSNYAYLSIYNSSNIDSSFMALFNWHQETTEWGGKRYQRKYADTISEEQIFDKPTTHNLSWGVDDKIYRATQNGFEIVRFNNHAKLEYGEKLFDVLKSIDLFAWKGQVIGGGTAYFGTIVECENALVVMLSNQESYTITGPVTRWRIYPRSRNYENHLHVILEDKIEIYSFNHDYFLQQDEKILGLEYKVEKHVPFQRSPRNFFN